MKRIAMIVAIGVFLILPVFASGTEEGRTITDISVSEGYEKLQYLIGEELDISGLYIDITYSDGNLEKVKVTQDMVSGFSNSALGAKLLTIMYENKACTLTVYVVEEYTYESETERPPLDGFDTGVSVKPSGSGTGAPNTVIIAVCAVVVAAVGGYAVYRVLKGRGDSECEE